MTSAFLSRFTPSMMSAEALESIFVQRHDTLKRTVDLIVESATAASKHHVLYIGPRGIGKTHLVSLVYHRTNSRLDLRSRLVIAWLREEEWGVTSFLELMLRILKALQEEYQDQSLAEATLALYDLEHAAAARRAGDLLRSYANNRALLVLVENLDELFQGLGDTGQKQMRAYIQENPFWTIVATAQSLFNGVSLRSSPFYGFFHITHLEELSIEDATELLLNIARYQGDHDLAALLETQLGRARVKAVHHLARGNHRVYVILSQFLSRQDLDELVGPFLRTLDELTPYYQMRMSWLSPQQRKIVEILVECRGAVPVKLIAHRGFMSQQTASSQLKELREKGYATVTPVGRESYYELREPLLRMCLELKQHGAGPLRVFIDLLRLWYTRGELRGRLSTLSLAESGGRAERGYIEAALKEYDGLEARTTLSTIPRFAKAAEEWHDSNAFSPTNTSWTEIYGYIRFLCQRVAYRYKVDYDDLAQETSMALIDWSERHRDSPQEIKNAGGYIYTVASHEALSILKRERHEVPITEMGERFTEYLHSIPDPRAFKEIVNLREGSFGLVSDRVRDYWIGAAGSRKTLEQRMAAISRKLIKYGAESILAGVLLDGLRELLKLGGPTEGSESENWYFAARKVFGKAADLAVPLKLMDVALRLATGGDPRPLFELPIEQRRLIEPWHTS